MLTFQKEKLPIILALFCGLNMIAACGKVEDKNRRGESVITKRQMSTVDFAAASQSVVLLIMNGQYACSGSIVSDQHVLTAAHCANGYSKIEFEARDGKVFTSTKFHIHENYRYSPSNDFIQFDLALIDFEEGAFSPSDIIPIDMNSERVLGQFVGMLGWGDNEYFVDSGKISSRGSGELRFGENKIHSFKGDLIETLGSYSSGAENQAQFPLSARPDLQLITSPGQASLAGGDSGGPLLDQKGVLIGVASAGKLLNNQGTPRVSSLFVNLATSSSRDFLEKHLAQK